MQIFFLFISEAHSEADTLLWLLIPYIS
ncbi:uncharacterized protein METZ01_LOCUS168000, partial [marine metagenome]